AELAPARPAHGIARTVASRPPAHAPPGAAGRHGIIAGGISGRVFAAEDLRCTGGRMKRLLTGLLFAAPAIAATAAAKVSDPFSAFGIAAGSPGSLSVPMQIVIMLTLM